MWERQQRKEYHRYFYYGGIVYHGPQEGDIGSHHKEWNRKKNLIPAALGILGWELRRQDEAVEPGKQTAEVHQGLFLPSFFCFIGLG